MSLSIDPLDHNSPIVGILLCTYNGEKYLIEQLRSIANQTYKNWRIFASDDGSVDRTIEILNSAREFYGEDRLYIFDGPRQGHTKNFLSLIRLLYKDYEFLAFCDQDDIWYEDKLIRAINSIGQVDKTKQALYCSSTDYFFDDGNPQLLHSYIFKTPPSFKNALVQSIAGGNTMVLNRPAAFLLAQTPTCEQLIAHDWWAYILISGVGGFVFYDPNPSLAYRQHSRSLVGENQSLAAKIVRIRNLLAGKFKLWNDKNLNALMPLRLSLTIDNQKTLFWFVKMKSQFLLLRLLGFIFSGIRRQTFMGNIALFFSVIFNKV